VVAIVFMDIENIHVMRSSLYKLRDNLSALNSPGSEPSSVSNLNINLNMTSSSGNGTSTGGWLGHVASVVRFHFSFCAIQ